MLLSVPVVARLVLVGGGHTHCKLIREWPVPSGDDEVRVLVSESARAVYSGMVPGVLSGQYRLPEAQIALDKLARRRGWLFLQAEVTGISVRERVVRARLRRAGAPAVCVRLHYEVLSVNVGSATRLPGGVQLRPGCVVGARPIGALAQAARGWERRLQAASASSSFRLVVLGAGAAGVELALALQRRLTRVVRDGDDRVQVTLVAAWRSTLSEATWQRVRHELQRARVQLIDTTRQRVQCSVEEYDAADSITPSLPIGDLVIREETAETATAPAALHRIPFDALLFTTGAAAPSWLSDATDLATSPQGFIRVRSTLQSVTADEVFAAGDCAEWDGERGPLPKSGVYAVRQAAVLRRNLRRMLRAAVSPTSTATPARTPWTKSPPLEVFRPQRRYLSLINLSNGSALGSWGPVTVQGSVLWRWKDWLDRGWMRPFPRPDATEEDAKRNPDGDTDRSVASGRENGNVDAGGGMADAFTPEEAAALLWLGQRQPERDLTTPAADWMTQLKARLRIDDAFRNAVWQLCAQRRHPVTVLESLRRE
ncbi:hypothetical protein CDCA_CDCA06G1896 [Cyanidium caldarium]|uniref:FAD/NAD(P)-binding domain-containing protein n=1 Tax=Cyanidium caldarium TaxID=2771 RepID=A0AAV9IUY7_CYACA|nr:hypothetical protein CDCA_CDCA06G1896 [Cyanidium caldarium]